MDPRHLSRLQEEQIKAIRETDVKIEQLEHFKQDYKSVQKRLRTLPDKLTHDVLVPFGKLAFMPGRLTHTNEILVLLGDNWFVERSAKQAADIAGRRIQELDNKLTDLKSQQKLLQPRLGFTSDLQAEIQGHGDVREILEEYDESKEKLWDERHRKSVKLKEELKGNSESQNLREKKDAPDSREKKEDKQKKDKELWARLEELERLEVERGELKSSSDGEDNVEDNQENSREEAEIENPSDTARRVSWADKAKEDTQQESDDSSDEYTDDDDDDADSEADDDDDDAETRTPRKPGRRTIRFTHSQTPFVLPHQVSEISDLTIHSPADIYKLYSPKSILKKTVDNEDVSDGNKNTDPSLSNLQSEDKNKQASNSCRGYTVASNVENEPQNVGFAGSQSIRSSNSGRSKAFTGFVVEKPSNLPAATTTTEISPSYTATTNTSREPSAAKRVSKFKASRQHDTTS